MSKTAYISIAIFLVIILVYIANKQGYISIPFLNKNSGSDTNNSDVKNEVYSSQQGGGGGYNNVVIPKFPYIPLPIKSSDTKKNLAVAVVQLMANKYGANLTVDGVYGPKTKAAVKSILSQTGLSSSGNITTTTISRIESALGIKPSGTWEQRVSKLYSTLNQ